MIIGSKIIYHANVSSTNEIASEMINSGCATDGIVISAGFQSDGKGQRNNKWVSDPFMNLIMSVILVPENLASEDQFYLSMIVSLAVTDLLGRYSDKFSIKWPNDICYEGDKIAGILIENSITGNKISTCIAGIGININQKEFPAHLPNPVSLSLISGKHHNVQVVQDELCSHLQEWYSLLKAEEFDIISGSYKERLYLLNKEAVFKTVEGYVNGRITGVDDSGQLVIITSSGKKKVFRFKEVEFCNQANPSSYKSPSR